MITCILNLINFLLITLITSTPTEENEIFSHNYYCQNQHSEAGDYNNIFGIRKKAFGIFKL